MTEKEIVQALRCEARHKTSSNVGCKKCPYWEPEGLEEWQKLHGWTSCKVYQIISDAADAIERLTAERDALLEIAKKGKDCETCKNCAVCVKPGTDVAHWCDRCEEKCRCYGCGGDHWEWRGLPEAPEEGDNHGTTD